MFFWRIQFSLPTSDSLLLRKLTDDGKHQAIKRALLFFLTFTPTLHNSLMFATTCNHNSMKTHCFRIWKVNESLQSPNCPLTLLAHWFQKVENSKKWKTENLCECDEKSKHKQITFEAESQRWIREGIVFPN